MLSRFDADKSTHRVGNSATLTSRIDVKHKHLHVHLALLSKTTVGPALRVYDGVAYAVAKHIGGRPTNSWSGG